MEIQDIRELVPHSGAMVLLDRVVEVDEESLCAEVTIRAETMFCGPDGVGAWVGIEYMAQAIAAHAGRAARLRGDRVKIGFLLGTRRYECLRPAFTVGSVLRVKVRREIQSDEGLAAFECSIDAENERIARATLTVFQPANIDEFLNGVKE